VLTIPIERQGKGFAPRSLSELSFYDDASRGVLRLKRAGYEVVVVTNQPDVASGLLSPDVLAGIHEELQHRVAVDRVRVCLHLSSDRCKCRKPLSGLLEEEGTLGRVSYEESWMVGDRDSDILAGAAVGCATVFIDRGWVSETGVGAGRVVHSFSGVVDYILREP